MFLQGLMAAARGLGLDTCPQAAFTQFHRIVMPAIGAPDNEQLVCGMSLGWRDPSAIENTPRHRARAGVRLRQVPRLTEARL